MGRMEWGNCTISFLNLENLRKCPLVTDVAAFGVIIAGDYHAVRRRHDCDFIKIPGTCTESSPYNAYLKQLAMPPFCAVSAPILIFESWIGNISQFDFSQEQLDVRYNGCDILDGQGRVCGFFIGCLESFLSASKAVSRSMI